MTWHLFSNNNVSDVNETRKDLNQTKINKVDTQQEKTSTDWTGSDLSDVCQSAQIFSVSLGGIDLSDWSTAQSICLIQTLMP